MEVKYIGKNKYPIIIIRGATVNYDIPFVLYGIHPHPPVFPSYAKARNDLLVSSAKSLAGEEIDYKMLVGDFNTTNYSPWFSYVKEITDLNDSNEGLGLISTWPSFVPNTFGLAIDNALISDNIIVESKELGPSMGSDHYPVVSSFKFKLPENTNTRRSVTSTDKVIDNTNEGDD